MWFHIINQISEDVVFDSFKVTLKKKCSSLLLIENLGCEM